MGAELGEIGEAEAAFLSFFTEGAHGGGADATGWALDHAFQRTTVGGIEQQAETGEQILDFGAPEEIELLHGEVRDLGFFEGS